MHNARGLVNSSTPAKVWVLGCSLYHSQYKTSAVDRSAALIQKLTVDSCLLLYITCMKHNNEENTLSISNDPKCIKKRGKSPLQTTKYMQQAGRETTGHNENCRPIQFKVI